MQFIPQDAPPQLYVMHPLLQNYTYVNSLPTYAVNVSPIMPGKNFDNACIILFCLTTTTS